MRSGDNAPRNPLSRKAVRMTYFKTLFLSVVLLGAPWAHAQESAQMDLPRIKMSAGMHQIEAQVARTPDQRSIGLMFRKEMPTHEGMLFVFEQPSGLCFWMKNTLIPLTAAFISDDGTVVNLADMKPQTTDSHCALRPVRYVLEMNRGWFEKRGIKAGSKISGAPFDSAK